jgi:hypothetical protein
MTARTPKKLPYCCLPWPPAPALDGREDGAIER